MAGMCPRFSPPLPILCLHLLTGKSPMSNELLYFNSPVVFVEPSDALWLHFFIVWQSLWGSARGSRPQAAHSEAAILQRAAPSPSGPRLTQEVSDRKPWGSLSGIKGRIGSSAGILSPHQHWFHCLLGMALPGTGVLVSVEGGEEGGEHHLLLFGSIFPSRGDSERLGILLLLFSHLISKLVS